MSRVAPHNSDMERAVICCCLINRFAITKIDLRPAMFWERKHQLIFRAILALYAASSPIDVLSVSEELERSKDLEAAGGAPYLVSLSNEITDSAHVEHYAGTMKEHYGRRKIIEVCSRTMNDAYEGSDTPATLISENVNMLEKINERTSSGEIVSVQDILPGVIARTEDRMGDPYPDGGGDRLVSGLTSFDMATGWWEPAFYIIASHPSVGKSDICMWLSLGMSEHGAAVGYISAEMPEIDTGTRLLSMSANINSRKFKYGTVTDEEFDIMQDHEEKLGGRKIYFDFGLSPRPSQIRAQATLMKNKYDIKILFIDNFAEIKPDFRIKGETGNDTEIRKLKSICAIRKHLDIPVVLIHHLHREKEIPKDGVPKRPVLSDMRQVGEGPADYVFMLYRENYQKKDILTDLMEVIGRKARGDRLAWLKYMYFLTTGRFNDVEPEEAPVEKKEPDPEAELPLDDDPMDDKEVPF